MSHAIAPPRRISDAALNALKERNPVDAVAAQWVTLRRKGAESAGKYVGPCPICSRSGQSKGAMRFECDADKWVCAVCEDGGDVIKLLMKREGLTFADAIDRLGGVREEVLTPALAHKAGQRAFRSGAVPDVPAAYATNAALREAYIAGWNVGMRRASYEVFARDRERKRLYVFWKAGLAISGTPVASYHAGRGLLVPDNARLKFHPRMPLFCDGRERDPIVAHIGPAQLAAFRDADGRFSGLHITWLDPAGPKGKAAVHHPVTGEVLPAKKMRGSKAGSYLDLGGCAAAEAQRVIAGEGIETVLAVYTALCRAGRDVSGDMLRAAGDLGNLAGRALATEAHPDLKTPAGRPQRVPGPDPDLTSPAMPVPDSIPELLLLGDGDSDPFLTRNAMERASRRHARAGRTVRVRFAPAGLDFDDMIQGKTE